MHQSWSEELMGEQSKGLWRDSCHGNCSESTEKKAFFGWVVYYVSFWWHCLPKYYQTTSCWSRWKSLLWVWLLPGTKMGPLWLVEMYRSKFFHLFPQVLEERCRSGTNYNQAISYHRNSNKYPPGKPESHSYRCSRLDPKFSCVTSFW